MWLTLNPTPSSTVNKRKDLCWSLLHCRERLIPVLHYSRDYFLSSFCSLYLRGWDESRGVSVSCSSCPHFSWTLEDRMQVEPTATLKYKMTLAGLWKTVTKKMKKKILSLEKWNGLRGFDNASELNLKQTNKKRMGVIKSMCHLHPDTVKTHDSLTSLLPSVVQVFETQDHHDEVL